MSFQFVAKCVYLLAAIGTFALAFLSLYDAYKAKAGEGKRDYIAVAQGVEAAHPQSYP